MQVYLGNDRWDYLSKEFLATFNRIFGLPIRPPLLNTLSAGLSALKTPACKPSLLEADSPHQKPENAHRDRTQSTRSRVGAASDVTPGHSTVGASNTVIPAANTVREKIERYPIRTSYSEEVPRVNLCPICSTELDGLALNMPRAHHTKSIIIDDPVAFPDGRIYSASKLRELSEKHGVVASKYYDPLRPRMPIERRLCRKVFIT